MSNIQDTLKKTVVTEVKARIGKVQEFLSKDFVTISSKHLHLTSDIDEIVDILNHTQPDKLPELCRKLFLELLQEMKQEQVALGLLNYYDEEEFSQLVEVMNDLQDLKDEKQGY